MFKEKYTCLIHQVAPEENLIHATIKVAQQYEKEQKTIVHLLRKPMTVFVSICLCIFLAVPALAVNVESIYQIMYLVSPSIAQFFMPVQKSDEYNGIRMEVLSAYIHENTAEIYITLQDLTGDRIDGDIDLYDSYSIHRPFNSSGHCEFIGYDGSTSTATFLITVEEWGTQKITGDKITFSVREFLSHKNVYQDVAIPFDLSSVTVAESTQSVSSNGGGGHDYMGFKNFEKNPIAIVPSAPWGEFPIAGLELTGIGYIDEFLHIQTADQDPLSTGNHGYVYLKDKDGTVIKPNFSFSFSNQYEQQEERIDYKNDVFDVPQEELSKYTLYGNFITYGMNIKGDWRVTFPLEKAK